MMFQTLMSTMVLTFRDFFVTYPLTLLMVNERFRSYDNSSRDLRARTWSRKGCL